MLGAVVPPGRRTVQRSVLSVHARVSGPPAIKNPHRKNQGAFKRRCCMYKVNELFARAGRAVVIAAAFATAPVMAQAPMELKVIAPAAPGGGWDGASRSLQQAMVAAGAAKSVQVINVTGAGGTVGLAQVVNSKGDANQLMVNGFVMVGAILLNKSAVSLDQVTPIARLTEETEVVVVPTDSPIKNAKDLADAIKKDVSKVTFAGGSAGGVDHILAGLIVKAAGADPAKVNYIPFSGGGESLAAILG